MMTKRLPFQLFAIGIVALFAVGCSQDSSSSTSSDKSAGGDAKPSASADTKNLQLAFVTNNASDYWTIARKGVEKAEKEDPTVKVDFRMPANGTAAEQKEIFDDLLAKGTQGIAISPKDPANEVEMINSAAKKALVFTQDSDAANTDRACYIGTDNVAAGRQAGEAIKKALPGGGKIMFFVGSKDAQNAKDRYDGIQEALKGSNITTVDIRTDEADHAKAKTNVSDAIVANPDLVGLVGLWSYNGPAIHNALKDAGKLGKIKIVCFDEEDETLAGVKDGTISATIVQQPFEFGYQAVKIMAKVLRGDKSDIPASKQKFVETKVITKDNVDEFAANLKKQRAGG
jgi:ribose transport system substrate-binding protein